MFIKPLVPTLVLLLAPAAFGQAPPPQGLDALDDSRVLTEVAGRGLTDLLEHAFDARNVPADRRAALLARISLNRLQSGEPLSVAERRQLVGDVSKQIADTLPQANDPQLLFDQAQLLMTKGVNDETRLLEYFGDNPDLRQYLKPVTAAVSAIFDRAAALFQQQADAAADQIQSPGDAATKRWQEADSAARKANDFGVFADYNRLLSLDPDDPQRLTLADKLIAAVKPADVESNPRRAFVQAYLGKVGLARGGEQGYPMARQYLDQAVADTKDSTEAFDPRFFRVVVDIEDRKLDAAKGGYDGFMGWFRSQNLPDRTPLTMVLDYRLNDAFSKYGPTAAVKTQAGQRATQILLDLVDKYEGYRPVVTDQLLARVGPGSDLSSLSPLLLDALVDKGRGEAARLAERQATTDRPAKGAGGPVDRGTIERGVAAAKELLARPTADPAMVARDAFLMGLMQDLLGDKADAADTFINYGEVPGAPQQQTVAALRRALGIVDGLKASAASEQDKIAADALEGRLLPLLVGPPTNDKSRAFDLANRLHRLGQLDGAIQYYREVPQDDPRKADARYLLLLAESSRAAELPADAPARATLMSDIPALGGRTLDGLKDALSAATADDVKLAYRERIARTKVMLARLALNEENQPKQALTLLSDIETDVTGLPAADAILSAALPLRFQATAATGEIDRATSDLLALLERSDAQRGLFYISQFREALNRAMDRARARDDRAAMRQTMDTRAAVTPKLVDWIEKSADPAYKQYVYNFRRFNAETQYQAALLIDDPAARRARLAEALAAYEGLDSPQGLAQYRSLLQGMDEQQRAAVPYDRDVVFALGNIHFELAKLAAATGGDAKPEYELARSRYGRLLADRAMGGPTKSVEEDAVSRQTPNGDYFELYLKFIQSNLGLGNAPEKMATELRKLYIVGGDALRGTQWADEYAALARELGVQQP